LLPQTRRHSLLVQLLRVPNIVFAVNKLDAVENPALAFAHISAALRQFTEEASIAVQAVVPISALKGHNVVDAQPGWCGYQGPSLLGLLEGLSVAPAEVGQGAALPVQWVERFHASSDTSQGRRVFWGRVATGQFIPGQAVTVLPSGKSAVVAEVLDHSRRPLGVSAGRSAGLILDRELDVSRGDTLVTTEASPELRRELRVRVAWLDDEPLVPGRLYWALHGHRWVKAKVSRIVHQLHIDTLQTREAAQLGANAIGLIDLSLQEALPTLPYAQSRALGSLVLVDTASHRTAGAVLVESP
jgi:sulfate adenylyltransferase subunit 1